MKRLFFFIASLLTCVLGAETAKDPLLVVVIMVKNEGTVIQPTLLPYIEGGVDAFFVFDTGSTDDTIAQAQKLFDEHKVRSVIMQEPFVDFSTSRNRAIELAQEKFPNAAFMLMPDAEWYMQNTKGLVDFCKEELANVECDSYKIRTLSGHDYYQSRLFRPRCGVKFMGAVHEYLQSKRSKKAPPDIYWVFKRSNEGYEKSAKRWHRDLEILTAEHEKNPQDARTVFYLAQTYDCLNQWENAYKYYSIRAKIKDWDEENFVAQYRAGKMAEILSKNDPDWWPKALNDYCTAFAMRPSRAEPIIKLAQYYLVNGKRDLGHVFAKRAAEIPYPKNDTLFVEKDLYDYTRWDVLGQTAWYASEWVIGEDAVRKALEVHPDKAHLHSNLDLYLKRKVPELKLDIVKDIEKTVTIAILAKDKEHTLPLYLECIEKQTWPAHKTNLYIRTNNNNDGTAALLRDWVAKVKGRYHEVYFDDKDVEQNIQQYGQHEWNKERFRVLARIRQASVDWAKEKGSHYFVVDCDNFVKPHTIESLLSANVPVVAPLLRTGGVTVNSQSNNKTNYSNFHGAIDKNGYFLESSNYFPLLNREIKGLVEVPLVHCTYLIRNEVLPFICYDDNSNRYEYVIFSDNLRKLNIPQYLDNREQYGWLTFAETSSECAMEPWYQKFGQEVAAK